jgi:FkbM family methyltransferase
MKETDYPRLLEGLTKALEPYYIVEGGSYQIDAQSDRLRELVLERAPQSIMEIGFNAGHSALLFLATTPPETKVVSFDLGEYAYVFAAKRYIDSVFPGRHTLVTGDSTTTIPKYEEQVAHRMKNPATAPPLLFDFIFIDGGHQGDIPLKDILNSLRLARDERNIVAIDDISRDPSRQAHYTVEPTKAWSQMVSAGNIREFGYDDYFLSSSSSSKCPVDCNARGMAWGTYNLSTSDAASAGTAGTAGTAATDTATTAAARLKKLRYIHYQNSYKPMDRNQMLQEIHNQHHYNKDYEKLVALADMYLDYFPTHNKRDTNFVRFYRAGANFAINPALAVTQYEEIVDTPSPAGVNDGESELPDHIKESSIANLGMLYPKDPCAEIPRVIHLLYFGETEFYNFHHRCVHSMLQYMPNYEIRIYNSKEPVNNKYWDDIKAQAGVRILKIDVPQFFDGFELKHFQYKADVVRLELLYEHGGVYLDLDMVITRPFDQVFKSGHSFYISEERTNCRSLINAFLAAKPKNEFIKLWLNEFKSGLRLGIWAHHIRDSNKKLIDDHPHYLHKYRMKVLDGIVFMPLHWQDTVAFLNSETVPYEFPAESYGTHLWETILGDVMRRNEFLHKQKMELTVYKSRASAFCEVEAVEPAVEPAEGAQTPEHDDLTIYPEYYHDFRNDQFVDKYITKGKHGGYFIEIGAADGVSYSSCYFFERYRDWRGLAIEPARVYHDRVRDSRANPIFSAVSNVTSCMTNGSGSGAIFYESNINELSGLKGSLENNKDCQEWTRTTVKSYKVDTITLYDLCCQQSAPEHIDYCAIDCEGAEYEILSTFFEENQSTTAGTATSDEVGLVVSNKVFQIEFFSIEMSTDKIYTRIRDLLERNNYEEVLNPYLKVIKCNGRTVTWEKYFKYKGVSPETSPQMSDGSLSSVSSSALFTPQPIHTPPSSPSSPSQTDVVTGAGFLLKSPFAEEVVAICLEERPDRTKYVSDHLREHGIKHTLLMNHLNTEDPKVGCFRSHIKAIQYAKTKNLSSVLIVEDDIVICDNIMDLARVALPRGDGTGAAAHRDLDWDILYLGGILTRYDGIDAAQKWVRGTIWCNHAYLVKQHMYQPILDFVESYPNLIELERKNIDFMYTEYIQPKYNCWLANEQYIIQKEGYSEIDCRVKWSNGFDWSTFSMKVI